MRYDDIGRHLDTYELLEFHSSCINKPHFMRLNGAVNSEGGGKGTEVNKNWIELINKTERSNGSVNLTSRRRI
jgi:hypothetical protein